MQAAEMMAALQQLQQSQEQLRNQMDQVVNENVALRQERQDGLGAIPELLRSLNAQIEFMLREALRKSGRLPKKTSEESE